MVCCGSWGGARSSAVDDLAGAGVPESFEGESGRVDVGAFASEDVLGGVDPAGVGEWADVGGVGAAGDLAAVEGGSAAEDVPCGGDAGGDVARVLDAFVPGRAGGDRWVGFAVDPGHRLSPRIS